MYNIIINYCLGMKYFIATCYTFSTRNNCCEFLASYGVIIQSVIQSCLYRSLSHEILLIVRYGIVKEVVKWKLI